MALQESLPFIVGMKAPESRRGIDQSNGVFKVIGLRTQLFYELLVQTLQSLERRLSFRRVEFRGELRLEARSLEQALLLFANVLSSPLSAVAAGEVEFWCHQ